MITKFEKNQEGGFLLFVIGDIHGCYDELGKSLKIIKEEINKNKDRKIKIIFIGDYIDRGKFSYEVITEIIYIKNNPSEYFKHDKVEVICLLGNHEEMMLRDRGIWFRNGGEQTIDSYEVNGYDVGRDHNYPEDHKEFLENLDLYYAIEECGTNKDEQWVFVHAGIDNQFGLNQQCKSDLIWLRKHYIKSFNNYSLNDLDDTVKICVGHTPVQEVQSFPNYMMVDTGCCFGYKLSTVVLDTNKEFQPQKIIEVKTNVGD